MSKQTMNTHKIALRPHRLNLLSAALLCALPLAAQAAGVTPGAGSILQQIQPPAAPEPSSGSTGLALPPQGEAPLPNTAPFPVKRIAITGNTLVKTEVLHDLVKDGEGRELTLAQLGELAARITDYYRRQGYVLSQGIVPAQTIKDGVVTIDVVEARYGKVELDNRSRVRDGLLRSTLSSLQPGRPIVQSALNRDLLLLSDIPGVVSSATLKPGQAVGTADLKVDTHLSSTVSGEVTLDNSGNRYTGRARVGGTVNLINPLHSGDVLSLSGLTSGSVLNYGRIGYEALLDGSGTRAGGAYSSLRYRLGDTLSAIGAHGTAEIGSLWLKRPLLRSLDLNFYGQLQYDHKQLKDDIDTTNIRTDRHQDGWTASLSGDARDGLLSGGITTWNVGLSAGRLGFDNAAAAQADAVTARSAGSFTKWMATLARLQSLNAGNALYVGFSGQWANKNLNPAEQMIAGGPYSVRAYDIGALSGDSGYLGTVELRHDLGWSWPGQWQAVAFADSQHLTVNKNPWTLDPNSATLSGVGAGLNWAGPQQWAGRIYVAKPVGSTPALIGAAGRKTRAWLQVSKGF